MQCVGRPITGTRIGRGVSEDDPSFTGTYKVPLIGIEVSNGRSELKSGVRLAGIEIYQVFPDSPGMRGHGQSADPGPDHKWSAEELLLDMKGFLDALGLDQVHYLGESIGGTLGIAFAVRSPERLKSLTLLATPTSIPPRVQKLFALGYDDWPTALGKLGSGGWAKALMESGGGLTGGDPARTQWVINEWAHIPTHVLQGLFASCRASTLRRSCLKSRCRP